MIDVPKSQNAENSMEGWDAPLVSDAERLAAVDAAFDYRGDVTVETADGRCLRGYIFDRRKDAQPPVFRLMLTDEPGTKVEIAYDQLTRLTFTGRDTALGKSWETWVKKYLNKKLAGESAELEPDPLD